jgi:hypothetical protein
MSEANVDPEEPVSWRDVAPNLPVRASDGEPAGAVVEVLGSSEEDIFHGLVIKLGRLGRRVFVPADYVTALTTSHADVDVTAEELESLPERTDEKDFEVGWTGTFRKHLGWIRDQRG